MYTNFYADRAAKNIPQLSVFEEEALKKSLEFRKKVINAFERVNGPGSELKIEIKGGILLLSWFRTTEKIFSLDYEVFTAVKPLAARIYNEILASGEKQNLKPAKFNGGELMQFISKIMKKFADPDEFIINDYSGKYILFGCRIVAGGEKKPIVCISSQNPEYGTFDLGILVSLYSVETSMKSIPNPSVVSNYIYNPEKDSFHRQYLRLGFKTEVDLRNIIRWLS